MTATPGDGAWGAAPNELEFLAQTLLNFSEALDIRRREINTLLHTVNWEGEQADAFRSAWYSQYLPRLLTVISMLVSAASTVRYQAQQQEWASGVTSPSGSLAMPPAAAHPSHPETGLRLPGWLMPFGRLAGSATEIADSAIGYAKDLVDAKGMGLPALQLFSSGPLGGSSIM